MTWFLYVFMALLSASVVMKLVQPLLSPGTGGRPTRRRDRAIARATIVMLPLVALLVYHALGRPDLRGNPLYLYRDVSVSDRNAALLAVRPMRALLSENSEDIGALVAMGQLNYRLEKFDAAAPYFRAALSLAIEAEDWRVRVIATALGETLVNAAAGRVDDDAVAVFTFIREMHPQNPLARYYLGLRLAQDGQLEEAVAIWTELLSEGDTTIYWKQRVRRALAETRGQMRATTRGHVHEEK